MTTGPDNAAASDGDGADGDPDGPDANGGPWTRRGLIAGVAAVGVGAAAALVTGAEPAGAADGSPVELGEENVASATTSIATSTGSGLDGSTGGSSGLSYGNAGVVGDSATTYGVIGVSSASSGVAGFTTSDAASGVYGENYSGNGVYGTGVTGVYGTTSADGGSGVSAHDNSLTGGYGLLVDSTAGTAVAATSGPGIAVFAATSGPGSAIVADSHAGYGVAAQGGLAPLRLVPALTPGAPTGGAHQIGELVTDSTGALFCYVNMGAGGTWVQVATGPTGYASGASCLLSSPIRLFDSRETDPPATPSRIAGPINAGRVQTLQITGTTVGGISVPAGAVAVIGNVTAVDASARGYLTCYPEGVATPATSSLNFPVSTSVANGVTVALSSVGQLDIYVSQTTDVIFDATGFIA